MMRVLHVLGELKASGAEVMLRSAIPAFDREGVETHILSTGERLGPFAGELESVGCQTHHVPFHRHPAFFWKVLLLMRAGDYDVVHLHTERANFWLGLVARASGVGRLIRTVHNAFPFDGRLARRRGWQRRLLSRLGVVHVAISPTVQENEWRRFGLKARLVDNWYDDARFDLASAEEREGARSKVGLHAAQHAIVSIGNCSDIKNHGTLLHALAKLPVDVDWIYFHLGQEEVEHGERRLAESLGIEERVRFLGRQPEPRAYLAAADVYVMPSLYEGFGVAAMEALAMGVPCILSDVDGLRDFRERFEHIVYTGTDAESLTRALQEVATWSDAKRQMVRAQFARTAYEHYRTEQGVGGYRRLYLGGQSA
jgi:glycosyltransferase involved in cell wall biosynthesis